MSTLRPTPISMPSSSGVSASLASPALSHAQSFSGGSVSSASGADAALRRMVWDSTLPIVVKLHAPDLPGDVLATAPVDACYLRVPRLSYLPLFLSQLRGQLVDLVLDGSGVEVPDESQWWFDHAGAPLRWHWPIGLLFDYHTRNTAPSAHATPYPRSTSPSPASRLGRRESLSAESTSSDTIFTSSAPFSSAPAAASASPALPWALTLHLRAAPTDKIASVGTIDGSKVSFMSMLKEADFVRWGSTKRVTNLRRADQDRLWDGVVDHDWDLYSSVASKLLPPIPTPSLLEPPYTPSASSSRAPSISASSVAGSDSRFATHSSVATITARPSLPGAGGWNESQTSLAPSLASVNPSLAGGEMTMGETPSEAGAATPSKKDAQRGVPMRFHLYDAPIVQEPVAGWTEDGRPATLHSVLSSLFPLLFPPTPTFSSYQGAAPPLAYPVIQGIRVPLDSEIPWLGAVLPNADGWVAVCLQLLREGERA